MEGVQQTTGTVYTAVAVITRFSICVQVDKVQRFKVDTVETEKNDENYI